MKKPFSLLSKEAQNALKKIKMPSWIDPMLATLTDDYFSDEKWIYERKLDGERVITYCKEGKMQLMSRNKKKLNAAYPEIVSALKKHGPQNAIFDGEVVAFEGNISSFSKLQNRMHIKDPEKARKSDIAVYYYLFDILYLDEYKTTDMPLRERKKLLKNIVSFDDPIRYLPHVVKEGLKTYHDACEKGWEGIIAKDGTSKYISARSKKWLKFKCINEQEFVIIGYTDPQGERVGFGSLLIGYYDNGQLHYAGKVGTGFDDETLKSLHDKLSAIEQKEINLPKEEKNDASSGNVHFVKPQLVCQVGFTEWTKKNKLRHPRYLGLRRDKNPKEVVRETPK